MRRCLHSLLVGVLTFSLAIDAARACGHLRHHRQCADPCCVPVLVVPAPVVWSCCNVVLADCSVVVAAGCDCGPVPVATFGGCPTGCEEIACGTPLACCGSIVSHSSTPSAARVVEARPTPAGAVQTPTPADAAPETSPRERAPAPLATVPDLAPVAPAAAIEPEVAPEIEPDVKPEVALETPADESPRDVDTSAAATAPEVPENPEAPAVEPEMEEPAPAPAVPAADEPVVQPQPAPEPEPQPTPEPKPEPPRRNPFEEADAADAGFAEPRAVDVVPPGGEPAAVDPVIDPFESAPVPPPAPASEEPAPASEPADEAAAPLDVPLIEPGDEPVIDPVPAPEPEVVPDGEPVAEPEAAAAVEPLRRWIDESGSFAVVGRLADVQGAAVEIHKPDGRRITVPLDRLSAFDRDYVGTAGPRVAATRGRAPRPIDTASR